MVAARGRAAGAAVRQARHGADGSGAAAGGAVVVDVGDQEREQHNQAEHEDADRDGDDQAGGAVVRQGRELGLHGVAFQAEG
jgi:hypothetical protein